MAQKRSKNPADYIVSLNINGLDGRMLRMPAPDTKVGRGKEIMFVYGHHSSLERWWGLAQALNHYGAVTAPDLPGFGGMDSFYTIGKKPSIDNLADYLAAFVKLRYKRKKVTIIGMSFGFVIVTRMLQRYPELTQKVNLLISLVGFAHKDDFTFTKPRYIGYLTGSTMVSTKIISVAFRYTALQPIVLRNFYGRTHNAKHKFADAKDQAELEFLKDVEVGLWHDNDPRTWAYTSREFLRFDNCGVKVDLPLWHIGVKNDRYFDNHLVEQHMRIIFNDFYDASIDGLGASHAPSVIADEKEAAAMIPAQIRRVLSRSAK